MIRYFVSLTLLLQKRTRADVFARLKQSDKGVPLAPYRCRPAGDLRSELRAAGHCQEAVVTAQVTEGRGVGQITPVEAGSTLDLLTEETWSSLLP